jgi:hypothetical protein
LRLSGQSDERERSVRRARLRTALEGGACAGVIAGAVLTLVRVIVLSEIALLIAYISSSPRSAAARWGGSLVWVGLKFPAYPFVGERSLDAGFDAPVVALGIAVHAACSIGWGVLFGFAAVGSSPPLTFAFGLVWGAAAWFVESQVLTRLRPAGFGFQPGILILLLIYGVVLARSFLHFERHRRWPVWRSSSARRQ